MATDRAAVNPFAISAPCEGYVPGWGDREADFHLIRGRPSGREDTHRNRFAEAPLGGVLESVGLLRNGEPSNLYASYVHGCPDPTFSSHRLESIFDAELRAITAHVLLPIGQTAFEFVLKQYTNRDPNKVSLDDLHAQELTSGAWLVLPLRDPASWTTADATAARKALEAILARDYRREADLGRHVPGADAYRVR